MLAERFGGVVPRPPRTRSCATKRVTAEAFDTRPSLQFAFAVVLASMLALYFFPQAEGLLQNGDSAVYNYQVANHQLRPRAMHIGYVALGIVFDTVLNGGTDLAMTYMCMTFGIVGLVAIYLISYRFCKNHYAAFIPVLLLLSSKAYLTGMYLSEVDTVAVGIALAALCCAVYARFVAAGIVFALALLVTPVVGFSLPIVLGALFLERNDRKALLRFATACAACFVPVVVVCYQTYFFGARGLFTGPRAPFDLVEQIQVSSRFFWREASGYLPLLVAAVVVALSRPVRQGPGRMALGFVVAFAMTAALAERARDVPVQLHSLAMGMTLVPVLYLRMGHALTVVGLAVGILALWQRHPLMEQELTVARNQARLYAELRFMSQDRGAMALGMEPWGDARMFEWLVNGTTATRSAFTNGQLQDAASLLTAEPKRNLFVFDGGVVEPFMQLMDRQRFTVEPLTVAAREMLLVRARN